jgi:hypothetical protein
MTHSKSLIAASALAVASLMSCGGDEPEARAPIARETPADEVLRIGKTWTATSEQRGLLSPPSAISMFDVHELSTLELGPTSAREVLVVEEDLRLRNGAHLLCKTTVQRELGLRWGRRDGQAAAELSRPALSTPRVCDQAGHPEPVLQRQAGATRFVLRSDNLVAVEPATDGRVYIAAP